ncbi:hypothetical protein C1646_753800 [Rhizophagus diaphanus]|nr:hypothetical protein C1646_753800 [Rhizophagus diaphanus] [Rhizophagus sp. MUCL 43196]
MNANKWVDFPKFMRYDEWDSEKQLLKRIGTHKVILKRLENVENFKKVGLKSIPNDDDEKEIMEAIQQRIKKKIIDINDDGDEINNSNLHSEGQDELEISDDIY